MFITFIHGTFAILNCFPLPFIASTRITRASPSVRATKRLLGDKHRLVPRRSLSKRPCCVNTPNEEIFGCCSASDSATDFEPQNGTLLKYRRFCSDAFISTATKCLDEKRATHFERIFPNLLATATARSLTIFV